MSSRRFVSLLAVSFLVLFTICDQAPVSPEGVGIRTAPGGVPGPPDRPGGGKDPAGIAATILPELGGGYSAWKRVHPVIRKGVAWGVPGLAAARRAGARGVFAVPRP